MIAGFEPNPRQLDAAKVCLDPDARESIRATPASVEGRKEEERKMKFSKRAEEVWRLAR